MDEQNKISKISIDNNKQLSNTQIDSKTGKYILSEDEKSAMINRVFGSTDANIETSRIFENEGIKVSKQSPTSRLMNDNNSI